MNQKLNELKEKIKKMKIDSKVNFPSKTAQGYNVALTMMTDLISCILVGLALGLFFQKFFHTSVLLTAILTLLGGIAGLYTVIRFAIRQDKK